MKTKEKRYTVAKIKIEKIVDWQVSKELNGLEIKRDRMLIATIKHGSFSTSFNATNKRDFLKRLREEIEYHLV